MWAQGIIGRVRENGTKEKQPFLMQGPLVLNQKYKAVPEDMRLLIGKGGFPIFKLNQFKKVRSTLTREKEMIDT